MATPEVKCVRNSRPAGRTVRGSFGGRRNAEQALGTRAGLWSSGRSTEGAAPPVQGSGAEDPCSLGVNSSQFMSEKNEERKPSAHLPENLFIVDAGFQVLSDGRAHGRLCLCTMLLVGFQELLKNWSDRQGCSFTGVFSRLSSWHCFMVLDSTWILKTVTCPETQHTDI